MKKADYKGFVLTVREMNEKGICYSLDDLRYLAHKYNCPIPEQFKIKKKNGKKHTRERS